MSEGDDEIIVDILLHWEELWIQGRDIPTAELCAVHPHLADEVARGVKALKATYWLDKPVDDISSKRSIPVLGLGKARILSGRYRLDALFAEGGFSQVWKGYDLELQREVAVKFPKPGRWNSTEAFMSEARRVALIKHPGIASVHDVCREDGACFIVSEFVEGGNLGQRISGKLNPDQALRWVVEVAEALDYAHQSGVIHRDIKPSNILIDHHGRALLTDFGIAWSLTDATAFVPCMGTLPYMPHEQLEGAEPDARSDIYSLGVVLHELLTGKLPYSSDDPVTLRREIMAGARLGRLPAGTRGIVSKSLQGDPGARYQTAAEMAADLRRCRAGRSNRWTIGGAGLSVLLAFGVGAMVMLPKNTVVPETPFARISEEWFRDTGLLPANELVRAVSEKLRELNPAFKGELKPTIVDSRVVGIEFLTDDITDILPLRAMQDLNSLTCRGTYTTKSNGRLANLAPLRGMKLTKLAIDFNEQIGDLSPLEGMPLTNFECGRTNVVDLSPLRDMPLEVLVCGFTHVSDLSPLKGMGLREVYIDHTRVDDLSPLQGMPLEQVRCQDTPLKSLEPLRGAPLKGLECHRTEVADLKPLRGMSQLYGLNIISTKIRDLSPLKETGGLRLLWCDFVADRDADILRSVKSLEQINGKPAAALLKGPHTGER